MQGEINKKGRKTIELPDKKKQHAIYCTDVDWKNIVDLAVKQKEAPGTYIVRKALGF